MTTQWHTEVHHHCFFFLHRNFAKKITTFPRHHFYFFLATQLIVWRGGWQQWCVKVHCHCFLFCYSATLRKGWQHGCFFFVLQHNSQSKEEDDDDDDDALKHVVYIFCFALAQFREKDNNTNIFFYAMQFTMGKGGRWQQHVEAHWCFFCFAATQLRKKDDDMGFFLL